MFKKLTKKQKDFIFIIFNRVTYLLEKIFVINPNLFSNENIGLKVRLYIENSLYFEYWSNNYILYNNENINGNLYIIILQYKLLILIIRN